MTLRKIRFATPDSAAVFIDDNAQPQHVPLAAATPVYEREPIATSYNHHYDECHARRPSYCGDHRQSRQYQPLSCGHSPHHQYHSDHHHSPNYRFHLDHYNDPHLPYTPEMASHTRDYHNHTIGIGPFTPHFAGRGPIGPMGPPMGYGASPATLARMGLPVSVPRLHPYAPAPVLHDLGAGPTPLFGWESVMPMNHGYGQPKYLKRVKPDYRRFCFSVGKADVPYASLPGGPLQGFPAHMAPQLANPMW